MSIDPTSDTPVEWPYLQETERADKVMLSPTLVDTSMLIRYFYSILKFMISLFCFSYYLSVIFPLVSLCRSMGLVFLDVKNYVRIQIQLLERKF